MELLALLPAEADSTVSNVAGSIGIVVSLYLLARTSLWAPFLVAGRYTFWKGLAVSWRLTRGHTLRIVALGLVLGCLTVPLFVAEGIASSYHFHLTIEALIALYVLALAQLYCFADDGTGTAEMTPGTAGQSQSWDFAGPWSKTNPDGPSNPAS